MGQGSLHLGTAPESIRCMSLKSENTSPDDHLPLRERYRPPETYINGLPTCSHLSAGTTATPSQRITVVNAGLTLQPAFQPQWTPKTESHTVYASSKHDPETFVLTIINKLHQDKAASSRVESDDDLRTLRNRISVLKSECDMLERANKTSETVAEAMRREVKRLERLIANEKSHSHSQSKRSS